MASSIAIQGVTVKRPQVPQRIFNSSLFDNGRVLDWYLVPKTEKLVVAPGTTLEVNRSAYHEGSMGFNYQPSPELLIPFHTEIKVNHPPQFSLYGKEKHGSVDSKFKQITEGMIVEEYGSITIPAFHIMSDRADWTQYQLMIVDNEKQKPVASIVFKEVTRGNTPLASFRTYTPKGFEIKKVTVAANNDRNSEMALAATAT